MAGAPVRKADGGVGGPVAGIFVFVLGIAVAAVAIIGARNAEEARKLRAQGTRVEATVTGLSHGSRSSRQISFTYPIGGNTTRKGYVLVGREDFAAVHMGQKIPLWFNPGNTTSYTVELSRAGASPYLLLALSAALCLFSGAWLVRWWKGRER